MKTKNWITLVFEYGREATRAGLDPKYISEVVRLATSKDRATLDAILAIEFYKVRQITK